MGGGLEGYSSVHNKTENDPRHQSSTMRDKDNKQGTLVTDIMNHA